MASPRKPLIAPIFCAGLSAMMVEPGDCNDKTAISVFVASCCDARYVERAVNKGLSHYFRGRCQTEGTLTSN
jgi:hypothetical protein